MSDQWREFLGIVGMILVGAAVLGLIGLVLIHRTLRRLRIPPNADFATTLRHVPLPVVIVLDLLDLGLDVFATPIVWLVLSRYRLHALRNVATMEALVPFTQALPTLTVAWVVVRTLGLGRAPRPDDGLRPGSVIDAEESSPGHYVPRVGRR